MSTFSQKMESLSDYMTDKVTPWTNRITGNPWVKSLQDSVLAIVPLVLVGSLITLVSILNEYFTWMPNLYPINQFTFGLMGLIVAFMVPYQVMLHKGYRDRQVIAGMTGLAVFLMLIGPGFSEDGVVVSYVFERFGAAGMFTAIGGGLVVGAIFNLFAKLKLFKTSGSLPDFLVVWFDSLIPILLCVTTAWILTDIAHLDVFAAIQAFFSPLIAIAQSFWGFVLIFFLMGFLYSFGLSTWIIYSMMLPIQFQAIQENAAAVMNGQPAMLINTVETASAWIWLGGTGATLPLVVLMAFRARSARLKAIGRASIVPSVFNINEPVVFGAPIAFNPILMIPMWINSLVPPVLVYLTLSSGLISVPSKVFQMWYMPMPISTWIISPGLMSLLLFVVIAVITTLIWLPFFLAYDKQAVQEDEEDESEESAEKGVAA